MVTNSFKTIKTVKRSPMKRVLSTTEFAEAIGISESTARRLADSGELKIQRTQGGHRKIPIAEAIRYVRENQFSVGRPDLLGIELSDTQADFSGSQSWSERLLVALSEGNYQSAIGLLQAMYVDGISVAEMCDGPIRYAMNLIGSIWPNDKKSIFIEHRATVLCVRALCQIRLSFPDIPENAAVAIGGAPQDDPFLLPSMMASLVLHECGLHEVNLGPNTPVDVLTDSVQDEKPSVVWLAITSPIRSRTHHREIEHLAATIDAFGGLFLIGGQNAATYTGAKAKHCQSMNEMKMRVVELVDKRESDN